MFSFDPFLSGVVVLVKLVIIVFFLPMKLIRNREIDAAINKLCDWYPQIVQVGALEEAIKYGRIELSKFYGLFAFDDLVKDCVALLAYKHPQVSFVGYLLEESQHDVMADAVNAMILSTNPNMKNMQGCLQSYLETTQAANCLLFGEKVNKWRSG
ncbi:hypothetical protein CRYUN_Cryun35bG0092800 [Craigia yunnanensis]